MSRLKYHGLVLNNEKQGQLRFGIVELVNARSSLPWVFSKDITEEERKIISRFDNRAYWQCANKLQDTFQKLNQALYKLSEALLIFENDNKYIYEGATIETAAIYSQAIQDIPYHLDAFIANPRILADCISFSIPFFYVTKQKNIPNESFRKHLKWFLKTKPDFDSEYSKILQDHTKWFELLAGEEVKGIRDINFHRFGTYQLGMLSTKNGEHQILISHVTSEGVTRKNLLTTLEEVIQDFFTYLDKVYELFGNRFKSEMPNLNWDLEEKSIHMGLEMTNIRSKYRLYPVITAR